MISLVLQAWVRIPLLTTLLINKGTVSYYILYKRLRVVSQRVVRVRMAERSKALRSGRSLVLQAWGPTTLLINKGTVSYYIRTSWLPGFVMVLYCHMHPVHNCRHIKLCPKQSWQTIHCLAIHLYYYSSPVRKNLSSKFDENLPERSQFDSDHRVHFSAPTSCQSATFVRPLFAFVLCFLRQQNHQKNHK